MSYYNPGGGGNVFPPTPPTSVADAVGPADEIVLYQNDAVVAGAGTTAANGTYTYRNFRNGKPYYNLAGEDDDPTVSAISWDSNDSLWYIYNAASSKLYASITNSAFPWSIVYNHDDTIGIAPNPTVTPLASAKTATSQQVVYPTPALISVDRDAFDIPCSSPTTRVLFLSPDVSHTIASLTSGLDGLGSFDGEEHLLINISTNRTLTYTFSTGFRTLQGQDLICGGNGTVYAVWSVEQNTWYLGLMVFAQGLV